MSETLQIGKLYKVACSRKGTFYARFSRVDDVWADGIIERGVARALREENMRYEGDSITLRRDLCTFTLVPETEAARG